MTVLTGVLSAALVVITGWFSLETVRSRRMSGMQLLNAELGSDEIRAIRSRAFTRGLVRLGELEVDFDDYRRLAVAYDRVSVLVEVGVISEKMLQKAHIVAFQQAWLILQPVIYAMRDVPGYEDYGASFARVATGQWGHPRFRACRKALLG
jgi:hypothetical protein